MNTLIQHDTRMPLLEMCEARHQRYCRQHGWNYVVSRQAAKGWARFSLILEAMDEAAAGECVVWLDSDSLIVRPDVDLSDALRGGFDMGMTSYMNHLNTAAIYVRNTPMAKAFIERCLDAAFSVPETQVSFFVEGLVQDASVRRLGPEWDDWYGAGGTREQDTIVRSWHGQSFAAKVAGMRKEIG